MKNKVLSADFPATPIWLAGAGKPDEYAEFRIDYALKAGHSYTFRISCDTDYNLFQGGELIAFCKYSDYPGRVIYDDVTVSPENGPLSLLVWHCGVDSQTHIAQTPYVVFCLLEDGKAVCSSSPATLSRLYNGYVQHRSYLITMQMGPGFALDARSGEQPWSASEAADIDVTAVLPRPNSRLYLGEEIKGVLVKSGRYTLGEGTETAHKMTKAVLGDTGADGAWYLFDLGRETVGFPELAFDADCDCDVMAGWGEHIVDGICRTAIGPRRFTFDYLARKGENRIFPALRRIGCRYFQFFIPGNPENVSFSLHPVLYPVEMLPCHLNGLRRRIYDAAVNTLKCCMHEHYEDCPWREQALYTLDSRNQMIAGYSVFNRGNTAMVRSSLDLISRGINSHGVLSLCYPAGKDYPIPFYTLAYFVQFDEYMAYTGDVAFAEEKLPVLKTLMDNVLARMTRSGEYSGLVPRYPDTEGFWNFYEWSHGMDGRKTGYSGNPPAYDAPFNAALVLAMRSFAGIYGHLGDSDAAEEMFAAAQETSEAIARVFLKDSGYFASFTDKDEGISVLTQAMCVLAGAAAGADTSKMMKIIADNGGDGSIPATLSMACYRYDAMLREDCEKYIPVIVGEIDRDGEYMLSRGATSFWETLMGDEDFHEAGSLCHGWSAMAVYYYDVLDASI